MNNFTFILIISAILFVWIISGFLRQIKASIDKKNNGWKRFDKFGYPYDYSDSDAFYLIAFFHIDEWLYYTYHKAENYYNDGNCVYGCALNGEIFKHAIDELISHGYEQNEIAYFKLPNKEMLKEELNG
jgi:hypothetical protein